jgi:CRISPR-associated protein Cmr3
VKQASEIDAHLVAARIPKHNYASGWKLNGVTAGQPKPTRRLVPAGSVFYFECASDSDADALWKALHVHSRSDECGEQGFGFGVCGNWNI